MKRSVTAALALAVLLATSPVVFAEDANAINRTEQFINAGATVDRLQVYEIAGIVILRGRVSDKAQAEDVGRIATSLGYTRVANLIQTIEHNDEQLTRVAERDLTNHRSLNGCRFRVSTSNGVIRVAGQVSHELQKDVALAVVRQIDGVRGVQVDLSRF